MTTLRIHSSIRDYTAEIEETADFMQALARLEPACFVVDEKVWGLYRESLLDCLPEKRVFLLPVSEERKELSSVQALYDQLVGLQARRNLTMVSVGGGITQDITGFAASTIYRGINWIYVPTTLLAMADSCVGSKTSLNYRNYKNLLGTFYPPSEIHIYAPFVMTLNESDFASGLGEVAKLAIMGGTDTLQELLHWLPELHRRDTKVLSRMICSSLEVKLRYMEGDEFDRGQRRYLNYGHDFGHALESTSHFAIPHGQAVIIGMLAANIVARERGRLSPTTENRLARDLLLPSLAIRPSTESLESNIMVEALKRDKKRTESALALVIMTDGTQFELVHDLSPEEVQAALDILKGEYLA